MGKLSCGGWSAGLLFFYPGISGGALGLFFRRLVDVSRYVRLHEVKVFRLVFSSLLGVLSFGGLVESW